MSQNFKTSFSKTIVKSEYLIFVFVSNQTTYIVSGQIRSSHKFRVKHLIIRVRASCHFSVNRPSFMRHFKWIYRVNMYSLCTSGSSSTSVGYRKASCDITDSALIQTNDRIRSDCRIFTIVDSCRPSKEMAQV